MDLERRERDSYGQAHRAELTAHCRRMLGSSFEAEDAVQETLLRAWRAAGRFESRSSIRTWLYRIATNVCLDLLGRASRQPVPMEQVPEPVDAMGGEDPCDCAITAERVRVALLAALVMLPPRQRAVLLLREVLSWRSSEVAELMGMTVVGVNSALQRARAALNAVDLEGLSDVIDARQGALVSRYLGAFATDDVDALVALCTESAPPV